MKEFIRSCAHVFAIMATIFNPAAMIAGGGVMELRGFPRMEFKSEVNRIMGKDVMNYEFPYIYSEDT